MKKVTDYDQVKTMDKEDAIAAGLYEVIGQKVDDAYIERLKSQVLHMDAIRQMAGELKIVYSPLHGTGNIPARRVLDELGFKHVYVVKEQELPDGNSPLSAIQTRNPKKPLSWDWRWQKRWMQIWYWRQTRMRTAWACT